MSKQPITPAKVDRIERDVTAVLEANAEQRGQLVPFAARVVIERFLHEGLPVLRGIADAEDA